MVTYRTLQVALNIIDTLDKTDVITMLNRSGLPWQNWWQMVLHKMWLPNLYFNTKSWRVKRGTHERRIVVFMKDVPKRLSKRRPSICLIYIYHFGMCLWNPTGPYRKKYVQETTHTQTEKRTPKRCPNMCLIDIYYFQETPLSHIVDAQKTTHT